MRINGVNGLACKILVKNLKGDTLTVEPILGLPVIKDLIVDMKPFFDHYKSVMPFLINDDPPPTTERLQSPAERPGSTTRPSASSAPAARRPARRSGATGKYVGPGGDRQCAPLHLRLARPGAAERLEILNDAEGVWRCRTVFNCTSACPRDIKVTQAIQEVKRAMLTGSIDHEPSRTVEATAVNRPDRDAGSAIRNRDRMISQRPSWAAASAAAGVVARSWCGSARTRGDVRAWQSRARGLSGCHAGSRRSSKTAGLPGGALGDPGRRRQDRARRSTSGMPTRCSARRRSRSYSARRPRWSTWDRTTGSGRRSSAAARSTSKGPYTAT